MHSLKKYIVICFIELAVIGFLGFVLIGRLNSGATYSPRPAVVPDPMEPAAHTLLFVGDMMFDRNIRAIIEREQDPLYPFSRIADTLRAADLTMGNLEGPISDGGANQGSKYSFRFEPIGTIHALTDAGFDMVNLANNHIFDYGSRAAVDTMEHLRNGGIGYVGFGRTYDEANRPVIKTIGSTTIAFLGFTDFYGEAARARVDTSGLSVLSDSEILHVVAASRTVADILVVNMHWGSEYETRASERQRLFGRALIEAGADLIIGHHPHVPQEVETYKNGYIAYSLGNFVFDQNFSADTSHAMIFKVVLYLGKVLSVEPIEIDFTTTYQPYIMAKEEVY